MNFTNKEVVELREKTGAGMFDCKKALTECDGNMEKAVNYLREKGIAAVAKRQARIAAEGAVFSYIHMNGKIGVLLEINCETDFVAKSDAFQELGKDVCLHIAAANPKYVTVEEVDPTEVEKEKEVLKAQALNEGKPAAVVDKMVEGRIKKFYKDIVLLEQEFVKDPSKTVSQLVSDAVAKIGEKISIRRFVRFQMGEGIEKRKDDFVDEVKRQAGLN